MDCAKPENLRFVFIFLIPVGLGAANLTLLYEWTCKFHNKIKCIYSWENVNLKYGVFQSLCKEVLISCYLS